MTNKETAHTEQMPLAIMFDVDGCLISTGGAGSRSWRYAFDRLHGIAADIGQFTEAGMTDPEVGRLTFTRVLGRPPTDREMARLLGVYLERLAEEVEQSPGYRIMLGVEALLPRLTDAGILLGLVSGALGGLDAVAFSGGIGEHSASMRSRICQGLEFLGLRLEEARNKTANGRAAMRISAEGSQKQIWVIPTDEEQEIARSTVEQFRGL